MINKPTIVFAHANGFPGKTYRKFFTYLDDDYQIDAIDNIGHAKYSAEDNWIHLAQELQNYIVERYNQPIIAVGHSLGGVLHLITALKHPELYSQLIMLDSPLYGFFTSILLKAYKKLDWMYKITPSQSSARRRNQWPTREAAFVYFKNKALYRHFDPECLQDYVDYGIKAVDGYQLLTEPRIEGEIFKHLPDNLWAKKTSIPTAYVSASKSHVISKRDKIQLRSRFNFYQISGYHLFPFEQPAASAVLIKKIIQEQSQSSVLV